ncbi:NPC intracellular cholesterol transporter 2 homolog a-like [Sitophilus oryzae]|uniref:NPC intracellular cholesterol transporter 2 homolog a-like n=1 Tax=Sitophilus oryzae TaxID=7048 RepID=A0A6J2Y9R3_SITOR|nr:NPC intracellular cholesterol transporter 2 homolog a-like [Sitophilus oryzae]
MEFLIVFLSFVAFFGCSIGTDMNSCSDFDGIKPNVSYSINSYTCESTPCECILGCAAVISVTFNSPRYLDNIKPRAVATADGVTLDYPLGQDDACDGITNAVCPIEKGELVNYKYSMDVPNIFPEITVNLRFSIVDKNLNEDVVCFDFDILVKKNKDCPSA